MITQEDEIKMMAKVMAHRNPIIDRLDRQTEKWIRKYGHTIDKSGHLKSMEQHCEYALEEATDLIVYLEDLKAKVIRLERRESKLIEAIGLIEDRAKEGLDDEDRYGQERALQIILQRCQQLERALYEEN
ncbi:hypothetical protein [Brevibacillus sp. MER 51]|uniref:hypothetical protein n=1 Tax=Brevibacillus sp. MER 51 TaxID=2939560 RepID=UPI00203EF902|nr:hypothetical protein [Brevibacillus sp. MER 51]MCM3141674.1 hypothetical protein [Brevibacillus sp. MER 51]